MLNAAVAAAVFYQDNTDGFPLCKNVFTQLLIAFVKTFGE